MTTGVRVQVSPAETEREAGLKDLEAEVLADPNATAASTRRAFVGGFRNLGRGQPGDTFAPFPVRPIPGVPTETPTETVVSVQPHGAGVHIVLDVHTAPELNRLLRAVGVELSDDHLQGLRTMLKQPERQRARYRDAATVARVLTLHYLTVAGGGELTMEQAALRYANEWDRTLPSGWEKEQWAVLRGLDRDYGPV